MTDEPECAEFKCKPLKGAKGITFCIYCGAELLQVGDYWFHWSQFDNNGILLSPDNPQDIVT
jgi:hypothetical protein